MFIGMLIGEHLETETETSSCCIAKLLILPLLFRCVSKNETKVSYHLSLHFIHSPPSLSLHLFVSFWVCV